MEVQVAAARAYARIGEHDRANEALGLATRAFDSIAETPSGGESMYYLPEWRFVLRGATVYALAGDTARVDRILCEVSDSRSGGLLRWQVQADLNRALAAASEGDVAAALDSAVHTVERVPRPQHTQTMRQLVRAIYRTAPGPAHRDRLQHLKELVA